MTPGNRLRLIFGAGGISVRLDPQPHRLMRLIDERQAQLYDKLVALAGSPSVLESVVGYLALSLRRAPTVGEITTEIMKRRNRAATGLASAAV